MEIVLIKSQKRYYYAGISFAVIGLLLSLFSEFSSSCETCNTIQTQLRYFGYIKITWLGILFFSGQLFLSIIDAKILHEYCYTALFFLPYFLKIEFETRTLCLICTLIHVNVLFSCWNQVLHRKFDFKRLAGVVFVE